MISVSTKMVYQEVREISLSSEKVREKSGKMKIEKKWPLCFSDNRQFCWMPLMFFGSKNRFP